MAAPKTTSGNPASKAAAAAVHKLRAAIRRSAATAIAAAWVAAAPAHAQAPATAALGLSAAEVAALVAHGPWPPAPMRDPSNRVSGQPAAIAFGERLFFDTRLSANGLVSCAGCHQPKQHWADGRERAVGLAITDRNSPSLENVALLRWLSWDGAHDNLWAQSLRPIFDPREMGSSVATLARTIRATPDFACHYRRAFGRAPPADDETVAVDAGKALAAFQETLWSGRTPFDDFRDALARGDTAAAARYPEPARRGAQLFVGRGRCDFCHTGPAFTNGEFADVGVPFFIGPGRVDPGRHEGVKKVTASRYNLLGPWSDDPRRSTAVSTRHVTLAHRNFGEFKVPGLRNATRTAPYMHNGRLKTISDVVRHYSEIDPDRLHTDGERILVPLKLDPRETADLIAFLESLSSPPAPFRRTQVEAAQCDDDPPPPSPPPRAAVDSRPR